MCIEYMRDVLVTPEQLAELYRDSGLRRPVDDIERMAKMIQHANLTFSAWQGDRLVGYARAFSDFCFATYLSDLAVAEHCKRLGIGKRLIELVSAAISPDSMLLLLSAPDAMTYYPHVGFEEVKNGWIIHRIDR